MYDLSLDADSDSDLNSDSDSDLDLRTRKILEEIFAEGPRTASDFERLGLNRSTVTDRLRDLAKEDFLQETWLGVGMPLRYSLTTRGVRLIRPKWDTMSAFEQMLSTPIQNWLDLGIDSDLLLQNLGTLLENTYNRIRVAKSEETHMETAWKNEMNSRSSRLLKMADKFRLLGGRSVWDGHGHLLAEKERNRDRIMKVVGALIEQFESIGLAKVTEEGLEVVEPFASKGILDWWKRIELEAGMELQPYASNRDWRKSHTKDAGVRNESPSDLKGEQAVLFKLESSPFVSEMLVESITRLERTLRVFPKAVSLDQKRPFDESVQLV